MDYREIAEEIEKLERDGTSYQNCVKLAVLYSIIDHKPDKSQSYGFSYSSSASRFLNACNGKRAEDILQIMDEHMEAIEALYPKEYNLIIERINRLSLSK